ncbi:MAG: hypothetical protein JWO05_402 [Gemmatimonadetes bacterium]|nr:hypothetical protein [Gemmatimonadota bacterium]
MRINSLHLQNFRQHVDTRVEFDTGLTGIIGSNGSGKTTLLEGIAWALYGMPAARGTRESIRSIRAGARAQVRVELDFELGGHRYRVVRGLTSAELYLDGAQQPIANSITGVTDLLRRRLGMSHEEFFNTYFTGQKELSVMAAMGPSERAQFLSRVLGYERLRTAQALVRDQRRIIAAEAVGLRNGMPDPESIERMSSEAAARLALAREHAGDAARRTADAQRELADVTPRWAASQQEREQVQEILGELRVAEGEEAVHAREVQRLERELAEMSGAREALLTLSAEIAPLTDMRLQVHSLDVLCREEGRRQALLEGQRSIAEELAKMYERLGRLEQAPELVVEAGAELDRRRGELAVLEGDLDERRTAWVRDRQEAETKLLSLRELYGEIRVQRERLVQLGEEGICPTCQRPLGTHFRVVLDMIDEQLDAAKVDGNYYKSRTEQLEHAPEEVRGLDEGRRSAMDDVAKLERRLVKVQVAMQELGQLAKDADVKLQRAQQIQRDLDAIPGGYDATRHEALQAEIARLAPLEVRAQRLAMQAEREPQVRASLERASGEQSRVSTRAAELRARREAIAFSEERYTMLRAAHERASAALRAAELAGVAAEGDATNARQAQESALAARKELARSQARLDALTADKRLHDELDRAYSDMRTDLNQQLRPEISEIASRFLADLTDGRYSELELDEAYNILVLEEGIPKPVISGGEEDLANLVLRLAISQMIAERAGQSFSLLILDEVFGSLDESRRHNVVELLRRLHDRFEQVIVITHIESVREGLDRVLTVRFDDENGASRVAHEEPRALGVGDLVLAAEAG